VEQGKGSDLFGLTPPSGFDNILYGRSGSAGPTAGPTGAKGGKAQGNVEFLIVLK
jgi:hypothetical protein